KVVPNVSQVSYNACSMCGYPSHSVNNCQSWEAPSNKEDDDNYNHHNNTQQQNHGYIPRPQQNKNQGQGPSNVQQSNVDQKFNLILSEFAKSNQGANLKFESLSKSVVNLERQMGQLAEEVHKREAVKLPSYPDLNPKHKPGGPKHVNMVTSLRNGKTYNNDIKIPNVYDFSHDIEDFVTDDEIVVEGKNVDSVKSDSELVNDFLKDVPKPTTQNPKATESPKDGESGVSSTTTRYPEALEKSASTRLAKKGPHSEDMWETLKQVKINVPLIDAIKKIPAYAKFLKDLCTQKRNLKAPLPKKIDLTEHVSAILSSSLPPKFKDPRAPLISVVVGNITIKNALLDLGASINILPASLVDKYDLGTLCKTDTIISLADGSTKIPKGILEDVIVKDDDFYYLVDFFVMDTESPYKDVQPHIILGRPFLATIDARINCRTSAINIAFECTLKNLHYVDIEKELFDGMMLHEKEEEF
nr:hypothetical protein [Tanacetum cinerariifolium]